MTDTLVAAMHAQAAEWEDRARRLRSNSGPESAASADLYEVLAAEIRELADGGTPAETINAARKAIRNAMQGVTTEGTTP